MYSDTITLPTMKIEETPTLGLFDVNWTMSGLQRLEGHDKEDPTWTLLLNITSISYDEMNRTTIFRNIVNLNVYHIV